MFFFKKNKKSLAELIPSNFVDIHSHLLPGIDDGAKTIADTTYLINGLKAMGFIDFITTPHVFSGFWDNTSAKIVLNRQSTNAILAQENIKPLRAAAEYLLDDHLVFLAKEKDILTLKNNHVLVEMSYLNPPIQLYDILFDLQAAGYQPVLAHPERYLFYHNNYNDYLKLKNAGCLFQLNLLSVVGYYGKSIAEIANNLLSKQMYDYAGSDVHHEKHLAAFNEKVIIKEIAALEKVLDNNSYFAIS